jgi:hypothetical protein
MTLRNVAIRGRVVRLLAATTLVAGATTVGAFALPGAAVADEFASASDAKIHPGTRLESEAGQCTANFIFTSGDRVFIGQAAHCTGKGSASDTDGCESASYPLGSEIKVDGADHPGHLVYNSWLTMQDRGVKDKDLCAYNDFALVEVDPDDVSKVNPSVPGFGGPIGVRGEGLAAGSQVFTYGNSDLRQGLAPLSPKQGVNLGDGGGGWTHEVATLSPGIPGDSGSGYLDSDGRAFGVLSTLNLAPAPGSNGVTDLGKALDYANEFGDFDEDVHLETGHDFHGTVLPIPALGSTPDDEDSASGASEASPSGPLAVSPRQESPARKSAPETRSGVSDPGEAKPQVRTERSEKSHKDADKGSGLPLGL